MASEHPELTSLFAAMQKSAESSSLTTSSGISSISIGNFLESLSGFAVRQVTNSRGETYPSDFGVWLPPLASSDFC